MLKLIAERVDNSEPGFTAKTAKWAIWIDLDGTLLDVLALGDVEAKRNPGRLFPKCPQLTQGELIAGGEVRSHFLVETAEVVTLLTTREEVGARVQAKHEYFVNLLRQAATAMPELGVAARVMSEEAFLQQLRSRLLSVKAKPADAVTLRVGERFVLEASEWHDWWRAWRGQGTAPERVPATVGMRCFVTGDIVEPVATHGKVKGLAAWGGQASGDALVSFDKEAFRSYGLQQSANAAMSEAAMTRYVDGINALLREQSASLAGTRIIYWFDTVVSSADDPLPWLLNTGREEIDGLAQARQMLDSLRTGNRPDLSKSQFYSMLLSGMSGRVMVRDWMQGRFDELVGNICRWFDDMAIVSIYGDSLARSPRMEQVVTCLLPEKAAGQKYEDWVKPVGAHRLTLWRSAIRGDVFGFNVVARLAVLCRTAMLVGGGRAGASRESTGTDIFVPQTRMGLIRAYHLRKARKEGIETVANQLTPTVNENHPSAAYQCGRLLAVLAVVQQRALGDVGAGVVERYYASASSTPALVLGRLTRTSQFHLNKLDPGLARWWEHRIASIWERLGDDVPRTLSLEEQSLFALGYYQQLADDMRKKRQDTNETTEEVEQ